MKNLSLPVAVVVAVICFVLAVLGRVQVVKLSDNLNKERYRRLKAEEQLQTVEGKIRRMETELKEARDKMATIQEILSTGQAETTQLKTRVEIVSQEKQALLKEIETLKKALEAERKKSQAARIQTVPAAETSDSAEPAP